MRFLLDSGRVGGKRLITEAGYRHPFEPQSFVTAAEYYPTAQITKPHWTTYGLGWFQPDFHGRFLAFHTGSLDGRTAMIGLLPDARTGVFIAGNLDHAEFRGTTPSLPLSSYAGTYIHPAWGDIVFTERNGALHVQISPTEAMGGPVEHWNYDTFRSTRWGTSRER